VLVPVCGLAALLVAIVAATGRGDFPIAHSDVVLALLGGGEASQRLVVREFRLPRAATGALVGAALGLSGAITQTLARNPLASPDVLGVTAGAGAAAVSVIVLGGTYGGLSGPAADIGVPVAAVTGGLAAAAVVFLLAWRRGIDGYRVVLVGVGMTAVLASVTSWLLITADIVDAGRALTWLTGSLHARGWGHAAPVALALAVLAPAASALAFPLGALQFDDDTVRGLGVRLDAARAALMLVAVVLAAVATAAAGPIAFVALVSPQIAMRLAGSPRPPLLAGAVLGAALTVWADLGARTVLGPFELPVGILTAVLGGPYLLYLIVRRARTTA